MCSSCWGGPGSVPEHYVDMGFEFETLNGPNDIPPEFQLQIQLDMSVVARFTVSLDTHVDGASYTTVITGATSLEEKSILDDEVTAADGTATASCTASSTNKLSPQGQMTALATTVTPTTNKTFSVRGSLNNRLAEAPDD